VRDLLLDSEHEKLIHGEIREIQFLIERKENCELQSPISRRISLRYLELGDTDYDGLGIGDESSKKEVFKKGLIWALKAVSEDSTNHLNYENLSMAYAATITVSGLRRKAQLADSVRIYAEEAVRLNPYNDRAYQILGRWHYEVSKLSPFLKFLSKVIFREAQDGSFEKAEGYFKKAIEIDDIAGHRYWLALAYLEQGKIELALEQLQVIVRLPVVYHNDSYFIGEAQKLIEKYG
jgi:tetratricopeptide (TPR) repeat protein